MILRVRKLGFFLGLAVMYAALLIYLVAPDVAGRDDLPLPLGRVSPVKLTLAYFLAGIASGLILGRLWSWATGTVGAVAASFLATLPFVFTIRVVAQRVPNWTLGDVLWLAVPALALGATTGILLWSGSRAGADHLRTHGDVRRR